MKALKLAPVPSGGLAKATVGGLVYPEPWGLTAAFVMALVPELPICAVAVAPLPPPPLIVIVGAEM